MSASVGGVGGMLLLLLLLLLKYYTEEKVFECLLLKQKRKNVLNKFKLWFKRRAWLAEQVLLYIIWTDNARTLNTSESAEICSNVGKYPSIFLTL